MISEKNTNLNVIGARKYEDINSASIVIQIIKLRSGSKSFFGITKRYFVFLLFLSKLAFKMGMRSTQQHQSHRKKCNDQKSDNCYS